MRCCDCDTMSIEIQPYRAFVGTYQILNSQFAIERLMCWDCVQDRDDRYDWPYSAVQVSEEVA